MTAQFKQILRKTVADCGHFFLSDCWMSKVQVVYFPFFFAFFTKKKHTSTKTKDIKMQPR